jgi:hypothetical protein
MTVNTLQPPVKLLPGTCRTINSPPGRKVDERSPPYLMYLKQPSQKLPKLAMLSNVPRQVVSTGASATHSITSVRPRYVYGFAGNHILNPRDLER